MNTKFHVDHSERMAEIRLPPFLASSYHQLVVKTAKEALPYCAGIHFSPATCSETGLGIRDCASTYLKMYPPTHIHLLNIKVMSLLYNEAVFYFASKTYFTGVYLFIVIYHDSTDSSEKNVRHKC